MKKKNRTINGTDSSSQINLNGLKYPKTYVKGTKLGWSAKNKEQRKGVRRAK